MMSHVIFECSFLVCAKYTDEPRFQDPITPSLQGFYSLFSEVSDLKSNVTLVLWMMKANRHF